MKQNRVGFSLVELSIVLVILGLLTGGILAGKSLIRASELRAVNTEQQRYFTATGAFRDKYFGLPGDITNATNFWGKADPVASTCRNTQSSTTATCDGDGNGIITNTATANENFAYWKQLANAGLIEGSYLGTGVVATGINTPAADIAPMSKFPNSIWTVYNYNGGTPNASYFQIEYGNMLVLSTPVTVPANNVIGSANISGEDMWNIDNKVDDGKPATGKLIGPYNSCSSGTGNTDLTATYAFNPVPAGNYCKLLYRQQF